MKQHQDVLGYRFKSYNILRKVGEGQFSIVYQAFNDLDNTTVAIKAIPTSLFSNKRIKQLVKTQIKIMKSLRQNPNIVRFIDNFKNSRTVFIVMEFCEKGSLQKMIDLKKGFSEDDARDILMQLINGFKGLHQFNIIHRDIKADNIMIKGDHYKIADLGFGKILQSQNQLSHSILGTPLTQAPQIYKEQPYGMKVDIWSLGVVFYQMIYAKYPYHQPSQSRIFQKSKNLPSFTGINISEDTKNFLQRCLNFDHRKRMSWAEVYQHPLLNKQRSLRKVGSVQTNQNFTKNKLSYIRPIFAKARDNSFNPSTMYLMKEGEKINSAFIEEVNERNELSKKKEAAINRYKEAYISERNNIFLLMKYLIPNACYIQKLDIQHQNYLFVLCKCAYQKLKQLQIQTKNYVNFLHAKQFFDDFKKSADYKQIVEIFTENALQACWQTQVFNKSFDENEIKNVKVDHQMNQTAFQYQNLLTDGLNIILKEFPRQRLIIMIESLEQVMKPKSAKNYQKFQKHIQTLDFQKAAQVIRDRQIQHLSQIYL